MFVHSSDVHDAYGVHHAHDAPDAYDAGRLWCCDGLVNPAMAE